MPDGSARVASASQSRARSTKVPVPSLSRSRDTLPTALESFQPELFREPGPMPASITEAYELLDKLAFTSEAERNALTPAERDHWLAAQAVNRMRAPLARLMPPFGTLDCKTVIAATKQALPLFGISQCAWEAICRRQHEFNAVVSVCVVVDELLDQSGPIPETLPDRMLRRLSTDKDTDAFLRRRMSEDGRP